MTNYKTDKTNMVPENMAARGRDLWQIRKYKTAHHLTEMVTTFHIKSYNEFDPL